MSTLEDAAAAGVSAQLAAFGETAVLDPDGDGAPLLTRTVIIDRETIARSALHPAGERRSVSVLKQQAMVLVANDAALGHTTLLPGKSTIRFKWHSGDASNTTFRVLGPEVPLAGGFFHARVEA